MHSTNSFLWTVIERVRFWCDDPSVDSKFSNDFIVRHLIMPAMEQILSRINANSKSIVVLRTDIDIENGGEHYQLPPTMQEVWQVGEYNATTGLTLRWIPASFFGPSGSNWRLEGNMIVLDPPATQDITMRVWWTPSGNFQPHYATDGYLEENSSGEENTFYLTQSPTLGVIDRRENAYVGQILRLIPSTGVIEERIIETYDVEAGKVTVRVPFSFHEVSSSDGTLAYEIAPLGMQSLYNAVSLQCARDMGINKKVSQTIDNRMRDAYKGAMKTVRDNLCNLNQALPLHFDRITLDNEDAGDHDMRC